MALQLNNNPFIIMNKTKDLNISFNQFVFKSVYSEHISKYLGSRLRYQISIFALQFILCVRHELLDYLNKIL